MTEVVFVHGKESAPWGSKIRRLAAVAEALGHIVHSPDFRDLADPDARVQRLLGFLGGLNAPVILVGSSMGGYACLMASTQLRCRAVFLLAPAIGLPGYADASPACPEEPVEIVHGWLDDIVPAANVIDWAGRNRCALHLLDDGHRLQHQLDHVAALFDGFLSRIVDQQQASS